MTGGVVPASESMPASPLAPASVLEARSCGRVVPRSSGVPSTVPSAWNEAAVTAPARSTTQTVMPPRASDRAASDAVLLELGNIDRSTGPTDHCEHSPGAEPWEVWGPGGTVAGSGGGE